MELIEPHRAAMHAGLIYVTDTRLGIARIGCGRGFRYRLPGGGWVREAAVLARIHALVIPPAWTEVWICPHEQGHIQATGFDAKARKQYRYHERWISLRNLAKFDALPAFGQALPAIRRRIARDLAQPGLPRGKVVACVVRLLDQTLIRIGTEKHARANKTYGLVTLRQQHIAVEEDVIKASFKGKSGKSWDVAIHDPRAARIMRSCQELPNQELFQYVDEHGASQDITSTHVNDYLLGFNGGVTAKDFRTWSGTVVAAATLAAAGPPVENGQSISQAELKCRELAAIKAAAHALGNTVATCRKYLRAPQAHRGLCRRAPG